MPQVIDRCLSVLHERALLVVLFVGVSWFFYGAIWRLYLSPIARFPGPRFAALTFWNEFYYDVVGKGRYTWKIADYHKRYGRAWPLSGPNCRENGSHAQAQLFGSIRTSFILMTQISITCCMLVVPYADPINGLGRYVNSI